MTVLQRALWLRSLPHADSYSHKQRRAPFLISSLRPRICAHASLSPYDSRLLRCSQNAHGLTSELRPPRPRDSSGPTLNASWHGCSPQTVYLFKSDTVGCTGHNQTVNPSRSGGCYSVKLFWWNSPRCEDECEERGVKADEEEINWFHLLKSAFFFSKIVISTIWVLILVHELLRGPPVIIYRTGLGQSEWLMP